MANITSNLDLVQQSQSSKEITINALANSFHQAGLYARRESTSSGVIWGYYGGNFISQTTGAVTQLGNNTITLSPSNTNFIQVNAAGTVIANTTGFVAGNIPLYQVVCNASTVTSWTDLRLLYNTRCPTVSRAISGAVTLTADECNAECVILTGTLAAQANITLPTVPRKFTLVNSTTGGFGIQAIQATGSGVVIANAKAATVLCGQTNVIRLTPDA